MEAKVEEEIFSGSMFFFKKKKLIKLVTEGWRESFPGEHCTGATINVICVISGLYFGLISVHFSS